MISLIEKVFDKSQNFGATSALTPFLKGDRAYSESLSLAGKVDLSGELEGADEMVIEALTSPKKKTKLDLKTLREALKEATQKIEEEEYIEAVKALLPLLEIQPKNRKALELVRKALHRSDREKRPFPLSLREDPRMDHAFFQCEVCFFTWNSDPVNTLQAIASGGFTAGGWCSSCQILSSKRNQLPPVLHPAGKCPQPKRKKEKGDRHPSQRRTFSCRTSGSRKNSGSCSESFVGQRWPQNQPL